MELEFKIHTEDLAKFEMVLFGQEYTEYKDIRFKVKTIEDNKTYVYSVIATTNKMPIRYAFSCIQKS